MATDLKRIGERARKQPDLVFTSLYHHINDVDNLRECFYSIDEEAGQVDEVHLAVDPEEVDRLRTPRRRTRLRQVLLDDRSALLLAPQQQRI